ncbi:MAG: plastocyanin/azurin family copper-binding protein [Proteobacteria bacterium]|nr:plastocyanin/azurin family copper-binding protein [Pseudomonadota bacterium]
MMKTLIKQAAQLGLVSCFSLAALADAEKPLNIRLSTKGNDIAFDQSALQVPFAKSISLRFINEAAKGSEILHNVAVLRPGTYDEVMKELQKTGYDIDKMRTNKNVLGMTKAIEPGKEDTVTFSPPNPGFYPYVCFMAGHGDMLGMKGVLSVQKK